MNKHKTKVITSPRHVPDGYTNMNEWKCPTAKRHLSDAHRHGSIRAVKIMRTVSDIRGPVFLHKRDADQYLANVGRTSMQNRGIDKAKTPNDQGLILKELRRIAEVQEQALGILHKLV